jgi:hypothetical protein
VRVSTSPRNTSLEQEAHFFEKYAKGFGLTPAEMVEALRTPKIPPLNGGECLSPEEIEEYCATRELPTARKDHLMECIDCRSLVAASLPTRGDFDQFLAEVRGLVRSSGD